MGRIIWPKSPITGWIYLVRQVGTVSPVKIGWSTKPHDRLKLMQWGSPVHLEFLDIRRGPQSVERALHRRFRSHRLRGEWYNLTADELIEAINQLHSHAPEAYVAVNE